ncbi:unnamed protein product [Effrenium voratum]|uniref:Uncharacterized protein n=1 Tax=Effrenium voratum TaxID=2562239 RepID=A0AA36MS55_9DINO|nr:unnamed protein product [Effrenium voratum]
MLLSPQVKVSYSARNCTRCCASRKDELGPGVLSQNRRWFLSVGLGVLRFSSSRASARRPTASQVIPLRWEVSQKTRNRKGYMPWQILGPPFCWLPSACETTVQHTVQRWAALKEKGSQAVILTALKAMHPALWRSDVKPSFLEQTPFKVLTVDLRHPGRETLELAAEKPVALGEASRTIKLEDPQRWGDPVKHYCAVATVRIAGQAIAATNNVSPRKVLAIFDTGTTGASMTRGLYDAYLQLAKHNSSSGMSWSQARRMEVVFDSDVTFEMQRGKHSAYGIGLDLVTPIDEMAWAGVGPSESIANYKVPGGAHDERPFEDVMLMGLGFLVGKKLAVDTVRDELTVTA